MAHEEACSSKFVDAPSHSIACAPCHTPQKSDKWSILGTDHQSGTHTYKMTSFSAHVQLQT